MGNLLGVAGRAVIRRLDGRVLMIRRADGATSDAGLWELPGGKMGYGDPLVDALAREVAEETGLAVEPGQVLHVGHRFFDPFWLTIVTFDCGRSDQEVVLSNEHSDHVWLGAKDLDSLPLSSGTHEQLRSCGLLPASAATTERPE